MSSVHPGAAARRCNQPRSLLRVLPVVLLALFALLFTPSVLAQRAINPVDPVNPSGRYTLPTDRSGALGGGMSPALRSQRFQLNAITRLILVPSSYFAWMPDFDGSNTSARVDALRLAPLDPVAMSRAVQPWLGRILNAQNINSLQEAIVLEAQRQGYVARTGIPEQCGRGPLVVAVDVARIGKVVVEGNEFYDADYFRRNIPIQEGAPLRPPVYEQALKEIQANPFASAHVELAPGEADGTADVFIKARDTRPFVVPSFSAASSGSRQMGAVIYTLNVAADLFRDGRRFDYTYSQAENRNDSNTNTIFCGAAGRVHLFGLLLHHQHPKQQH